MSLKSDGTVWTWGAYEWVDNGNGWTFWYRGTPEQVTGISGVTAIAAGWNHHVAFKPDGTVWTWGYNADGQLGDGTTSDRATPRKVDINLGKTADVIIPAGSININSGATYTNSTTVTLNLSASDSTGVTGYYLSTTSTKPSSGDTGWTSISSTTSYSADVSYTLSSGDGSKTVYVWYKDEAGNVSDTASDYITLDTTTPTVTITSPTSDASYTTTSNTVSLSGSASDAHAVNRVTWSNSRGGNGTASGTTGWSVSTISLSLGSNTITVTATDNAGNTGKDTITVNYTVQTPSPIPSPTPPKQTPTPVQTPATTGIVRGVVMDAKTGEGITGATVSSDYELYQVTTDSTGHYEITDIAGGYTWTFTAVADGYKPSGKAVVIIGGSTKTIDFKLEKIGTGSGGNGMVFGFVLDENGDSLEGVTVAITGRGNNQLQGTETDDDGYYEFRDLEAGGYTLTFEKSGYRIQTLDIILKAEEALEAVTITMELEVKGSIFGYVVDIYGNPIESVKLKLKGIRTKIKRNASSDADGFFEFADLEKDRYVIFASKKRYKKTKQTVSLNEGDNQEMEIGMRKSSSSRRVVPEAEE